MIPPGLSYTDLLSLIVQLDRQAAREQEELANSEAQPKAGALSFSRVSGLQRCLSTSLLQCPHMNMTSASARASAVAYVLVTLCAISQVHIRSALVHEYTQLATARVLLMLRKESVHQ